MNVRIKSTNELFDTKVLASGTLLYSFFPATPTSGVASNYQKNPFQYSSVNVLGIKASTSQSKFTYAHWIEYADARIEIKKDLVILFRCSLGSLLRLAHPAYNAPASAASVDFVALQTPGYLKLGKPLEVNNTESLYVDVTFLACTQTTNLKVHLLCATDDNATKGAI